MARNENRGALRLRVMHGRRVAIGPGKADLLEAIQDHGSISAAGRALGMSYRRTWLLVDAMNRCWHDKLVETVPGGGRSRGAHVTPGGEAILTAYRAMQAAADTATAPLMDDRLHALIRLHPLPSSSGAL